MFKKLLLTTLVSSIALSPAMATAPQFSVDLTPQFYTADPIQHVRVLKRFPDATPLVLNDGNQTFPKFLNQQLVNTLSSDTAKTFALVSKDACNLVDGRPHLKLNWNRSVEIHPLGFGLQPDDMLTVFKTKRNLTSLDFGGSKNVSEQVLSNLARLLPNLKSISISGSEGLSTGVAHHGMLMYSAFTAKGITSVIEELGPQLTHLKMSSVVFQNRAYSGLSVHSIIVNCPNLVCLNLGGGNVWDNALENIGKNLTKLTHLNVSNTAVSDNGLRHLANCQQLTHLGTSLSLSDQTARLLAQNCPNMDEFRLGLGANDDSLRFIGERCFNVTSLILSGQQFSNATVIILSQQFKKLKTLVFDQSEITDESLLVIAENFPSLKSLNLGRFNGTLEGLRTLKRAWPDLNLTYRDNDGLAHKVSQE